MENLTGTTSYEYDETGRITGLQQGDGSIQTEEIRTLDGKEHKTAVIWSYTYDSAGQLTGAEKRDKDGTLLETTV